MSLGCTDSWQSLNACLINGVINLVLLSSFAEYVKQMNKQTKTPLSCIFKLLFFSSSSILSEPGKTKQNKTEQKYILPLNTALHSSSFSISSLSGTKSRLAKAQDLHSRQAMVQESSLVFSSLSYPS